MICLINESGKERVCWALGAQQCQVTAQYSLWAVVPPADLLLPLRRVYGASAITCCIKACSGGCVYSGSFFCVYWVISIGEVAGDRGAVQRACPVGPI